MVTEGVEVGDDGMRLRLARSRERRIIRGAGGEVLRWYWCAGGSDTALWEREAISGSAVVRRGPTTLRGQQDACGSLGTDGDVLVVRVRVN